MNIGTIYKSCLYCFNFRLKRDLATCRQQGWSRIYIPGLMRCSFVEFRDKAKSCEHFSCETGEVWRSEVPR